MARRYRKQSYGRLRLPGGCADRGLGMQRRAGRMNVGSESGSNERTTNSHMEMTVWMIRDDLEILEE